MSPRPSKAPPARDADPLMTACDDWLARQAEMERLFAIADAAGGRLRAAGVTAFTEDALQASQDGRRFIDAWDRADALGRRNDEALRQLPGVAATSLAEIRRKLEVVAAAMDARESANAHALLRSALADLKKELSDAPRTPRSGEPGSSVMEISAPTAPSCTLGPDSRPASRTRPGNG